MEHEVFIVAINLGDLNVPGLVAYSDRRGPKVAGDDPGSESSETVELSELEGLEEEIDDVGAEPGVTLEIYRVGLQCSSPGAAAGVEAPTESMGPRD